ncbi:HAMP domain-containing sensor histidine kinase [Actinophytocola sp.]|uniref:sensor histidine kinase n=1 Tax=Actinophytocola sp. TaxID=1872138 RepID=UPI002D5189A4|nr:HAMP domain-containing sensor histidine kinase [Actinophytocola sp.]HYQ62356.1 HAMP domain-containing sensor histidine kinase [Actinophytocola sp.]
MTRRTVRWRLTFVYSGLFLLSGAALLLITYLLVAGGFPVVQLRDAPEGDGIMRICAQPDGPVVTDGEFTACAERARDLMAAQQAETLRRLFLRSGAALAIMTVASVGLGWLVAGRVLRPLRTITATTRRISASDLHQRLAMTGQQDEMKELGDTIDGLLARLEAAFDAQRQFVSNASHELRTPLARQRTLLEVALADPAPTAASLRAVCRRALAAGEQQERLIEALLTLARGERGLDRRESLDLRAITDAVVEARREEASARTVRVDTDLAPATMRGDARLTERLVANLVDNAIRHNRTGGTVEVATGTSAGMATLTVTNTGPVIAQEQLAHLFQPFARLAPDRTTRDGLGLGLPIVTAITTAHDATLDARPLPTGGLAITVRCPTLAFLPTRE